MRPILRKGQFLVEAVSICFVGGLAGLALLLTVPVFIAIIGVTYYSNDRIAQRNALEIDTQTNQPCKSALIL